MQTPVFAMQPPIWEAEMRETERPIWHIAAMAGDLQPTLEIVNARRKIDPAWSTAYFSVLSKLKDALRDERGAGIFFDKGKPANAIRLNDRKKLRFVHADVGDATAFIARTFGFQGMPEGFRRLHDHFQSARNSHQSPHFPVTDQATTAKPIVEQEKRIKELEKELTALKSSSNRQINKLSLMLYAVVKGNWSYDPEQTVGAAGIIKEIEGYFEALNIADRDGISAATLKAALKHGAGQLAAKQ
ncbi:hypothetical protein GFK26_12650 [Variovorax paradoxus]|uniref:Uncharacterized protein n=1 Tax=Variovorax paradoxus TaxID=34073 RepID=A0A5Q0M284_VARPD|nr:hypothetical protein [Variovorax paradoxus]QFZ83546.1 hypothetical protein GFK26_12650 [Variovorax paradoxus]